MPSIQQKAQSHLEAMVNGAAKATMSAKQKKTPQPSRGGVASEVAEKLIEQIKKNGSTIQAIPLDLIDLGENIRKHYDDKALEVLKDSLDKDGLIQYPTLCLRRESNAYSFVCRNGHRRILAAKRLGWEKVECVILLFDSTRDELYHTLNANIRENVFYLDLAHAYQQVADLGESDDAIAARVGLNPRTVGWYRRLQSMSASCQALIRLHPELFTATWAIKLTRKGPLPAPSLLETHMKEMVLKKHTWIEITPDKLRKGASVHQAEKQQAGEKIRQMFEGKQGQKNALLAHHLLTNLVAAGLLPKGCLRTIVSTYLRDLVKE